MSNTEIDVNKAIEMINNHYKKNELEREKSILPIGSESFTKYSKVYPFTNEKIKSYYRKFNYNGNVLTVTGSGEVLLHSILMGSKDITLFDINVLTKYYTLLKMEAIKSLTVDEFIEYFTTNGDVGYPKMSYDLFKKIEIYLDDDTRYFWNSMYDNFNMTNNEFQEGFFYADGEYFNSDYLTYYRYNVLKRELLEEVNVKFINKGLYELDSDDLDKKYIAIFLSNIVDYLDNRTIFRNYLEKELMPRLVPNGKLLYQYVWNRHCKPYKGSSYSTIKTYEFHGNNYREDEYAYVYTKR